MGFTTSINPRPLKTSDRGSWWMSLFILCAILGALMGLSFKTQNAIRSRDLPSTSYNGLAEGYTVLKQAVIDRERTIAALQLKIQQINNTPTDTGQLKLLQGELKQANFFAGVLGAQGPGLVVTLNDSKHTMPGAAPADIMPNLIHDTDINAVVNELKAAGAEAVSVNDQRLVAVSPIRCAGPTVLVNDVPQTPPYVIRAIGNPATLMTALNLQGGVAYQLRQLDPAMIRVQKAGHMVVPAYSGPTQPKYAKPVAVPGPQQEAKG
jgi:uncharacterized protein YlxW (UPF0749 family)